MIMMEKTREHRLLDAGNGHNDEHDDDNDGRESPRRIVENPTGCGDGDIVSTRWEYGVVLHYFRIGIRAPRP